MMNNIRSLTHEERSQLLEWLLYRTSVDTFQVLKKTLPQVYSKLKGYKSFAIEYK